MEQKYSGKFVLRIPEDLHRSLKAMADQEGKSLNQLCTERLQSVSGHGSSAVQTLKAFLGVDLIAVYQFGSSVRGDVFDSSDVDLFCVVSPERPISRDLYRLWDQVHEEQNLDARLSVHFLHLLPNTSKAGSLWLEVAMEGVVLYDPSLKVHRVLLKLRQAIIDGLYVRTYSHGQPVWARNVIKGESSHA